MRVLCVLLALGFVPLGTAKADYSALGTGNSSCGTWMTQRHAAHSGSRPAYEQWVLGFLSGIGYTRENDADPLNGVDAFGVWAWIDNYCQTHPIDHIADAAAAFYHAHPH